MKLSKVATIVICLVLLAAFAEPLRNLWRDVSYWRIDQQPLPVVALLLALAFGAVRNLAVSAHRNDK